MLSEFLTIEKFITPETKKILSIGGGLGGLESLINKKFTGKIYHFIERNFISKKVKYGWGGKVNSEAYNDLNILNFFLETMECKKHKLIFLIMTMTIYQK